jgi:hypothetical protein
LTVEFSCAMSYQRREDQTRPDQTRAITPKDLPKD